MIECKKKYFTKTALVTLALCLLFMTSAWGNENWVFFHIDKEYFFEPPHRGIPLKPLYQRETYYYDENSLQITGLLLWKTVKVMVKVESWGVYNNTERTFLWEVDCEKKTIKRYWADGRPLSPLTVETGDEAADAFYEQFCY